MPIAQPEKRRSCDGQVKALSGILALACLLCLQFSAGCGGGSGSSGGNPPPPPPNPVPAIVSLSPNSANVGGSAFTLTINGYNFMASSAVLWNGSPRTTTFTSSTQLQAQITAADIATAGSAQLSVTNPTPGGGNSGSAEFTINPTSNPAPTALSIAPNSVNAGSSGFILTVYGSNFLPSSTIQWDGQAIPTEYLSDTQVEAQIPASDLADPGVAAVSVATPAPGGGVSSLLPFAINYQPMVVNQLANDMVWDNTHQLIYLSVPSLASSNGNTVAALDPISGTIQSAQFAGSEPVVLAISDDGQFLYAGIYGSSSVQRFTLPNLLPDVNYSLGAGPYPAGPYYAEDLQVAPGLPHTTAVSRDGGGMEIFDDATQRPTVATRLGTSYDSLQWGSDTQIYAINNVNTNFDFYALTVNSSGVTLSQDYPNEFSDFYVRLHYDSGTGYAYTDDGYVINPANGQHVGQFQAAGYMVPDSTLNRAFFLGQINGLPGLAIESFDLTSFAPVAEIVVPNVQGTPLQFIRWGTNGLAFNDDAGYVYIINDSAFVGAAKTRSSQHTVSPVQRTWLIPKRLSQERIESRIRPNRTRTLRRNSASPQDSNPSPAITSLTPNFVVAGAAPLDGFTLTVTGSNFVSLSTVEWNGSARQTELVSSTQLQAQITSFDVQNAGSASVSVVTPSPAGGTSNSLTFTIVNQPPPQVQSISAIYPNSAPAGSSGITMQLNGVWLEDGDVVLWNGSPRPTSWVGWLQAQISTADLASPGYAQVTVLTPDGTVTNAAEFQILYQPTAVNQSTNDIVWDPVNQVFYISVPSSAATNANQVCVLNPTTNAISNCQAGNEPDVLAISDDSQFLYVGMDGAGSVQRFILPSLTPDISYSLGNYAPGTPYFALDLQVAPGAPRTTAVSKGVMNLDPAADGGITIYDDSTPRPTSAQPGGAGYDFDSIQWGADATELYAADTESSDFNFYTLTVNSSGVVLENVYPSVFWNPGRIHYDSVNGLIYSDDGFHVINPSTGLPVGIFEVGGGWPMAPDSSLNTVFILTQYIWQGTSNYTVDIFDMTHYVRVGWVPFPTTAQLLSNAPLRFITWGANNLAVNFKGDGIYLISGLSVDKNAAHQPKPRGELSFEKSRW